MSFVTLLFALVVPTVAIIAILGWLLLAALRLGSGSSFKPQRSLSLRRFEGQAARPLRSDADPTVFIEPLSGFDIWATNPIPYRPYATQGHVTMGKPPSLNNVWGVLTEPGIQKRARQEWIRMDNNYKKRIHEREPLIANHADCTIGTGPLVDPAIEELYTEIMIDYLPKRYPTIFRKEDNMCLNTVMGSRYPLSTENMTPTDMLKYLGLNVEEDFYFMCPDVEDGQFRLQGYVACFPGGFLSPARRGQSVREIHQPVPGYEEKLGKSVDRYFQRIQSGQFIGRMNVSRFYHE